jgi:hypothetical protein
VRKIISRMPVEAKQSGSSPMEQFVLLAKGAKGAAAVELVKQALEAPGLYVFSELIDIPNIKEVRHRTVYISMFRALIFDHSMCFM